jgi:hypothetical protein
VVVHKILRGTFLAEILDWIRPQYVAHEVRCWRLAEPIELHAATIRIRGEGVRGAHFANVVDRVQLGRYPTVYAQKLFFHDRREGQRAEGLEAYVVHALRVIVLALCLEGEVVGQVMTLMFSTEEEEGVWVPDLEGPKVE